MIDFAGAARAAPFLPFEEAYFRATLPSWRSLEAARNCIERLRRLQAVWEMHPPEGRGEGAESEVLEEMAAAVRAAGPPARMHR